MASVALLFLKINLIEANDSVSNKISICSNMIKINSITINLNEKININKLTTNGFEKLDSHARTMFKLEKDQVVWWSKNCPISFLDNSFTITPNLDVELGAQNMFGTSAYLFFKNNSVEKVSFQIIGNSLVSEAAYKKFKIKARTIYGLEINNNKGIIWMDDSCYIIAEKHDDSSQNVYFHWISKSA